MTNLNYFWVGVGEYHGHILLFCLSVIVDKLFNVLTLIDTIKKITVRVRMMHSKYDFKMHCMLFREI